MEGISNEDILTASSSAFIPPVQQLGPSEIALLSPSAATACLASLDSFNLDLYTYLHSSPFEFQYALPFSPATTPSQHRQVLRKLRSSFCNNNLQYIQLAFGKAAALEILEVNKDSCMSESVKTLQDALEEEDDKLLPPEYRKSRRGKPCGHMFVKGESIYRCRNCALDETCVFCSRCFDASQHEGHETTFDFVLRGGGCCDCGDPEAWKIMPNCKYHSQHNDDEMEVQTERSLPDDFKNSIRATIATILDFIVDTISDLPSPDPAVPESRIRQLNCAETLEEQRSEREGKLLYALNLWNDESHSFKEVTSIIQEVKSCSIEEAQRLTMSIDSYGRDVVTVSSNVSQLHRMSEKIRSISLSTTIRTARDTFREYITGFLLEWIKELAKNVGGVKKIDGEKIEEIDGIVERIISDELLKKRRYIKLLLIRSLGGNCRSIELENTALLDIACEKNARMHRLRVDHFLISDVALWKSFRNDAREVFINSVVVLGEEMKKLLASRFVRYYVYLSEKFMLKDREFDLSILNFTVQLFTVPTVAEYLLVDTKIVQTIFAIIKAFSLSETVDKYNLNDFATAFEAAYDITEAGSGYPPLKCAETFKSTRKYRMLFLDLRHIFVIRKARIEHVRAQPDLLNRFLDLLGIWQGMDPQQRHLGRHLEFESIAWNGIFQFSFYVAELVSNIANCYGCSESIEPGSPEALANFNALTTVLKKVTKSLHRWCKTQFSLESKDLDASHRNGGFRVAMDKVSFHHPMHWFLSKIFVHVPKALKLLNSSSRPIGYSFWELILEETVTWPPATREAETGISGLFSTTLKSTLPLIGSTTQVSTTSAPFASDSFIYLIEHPLRLIVMLSQIRANIWDRNGTMIRGQANVYRSHLKEIYDQDLFLMQVGAAAIRSSTLYLTTLIERFDLSLWFQGRVQEAESKSGFDMKQLVLLTEDFLELLIIIISERTKAANIDVHQEMKEEIIHVLARSRTGVGYSVITKKLPDRLISWAPETDDVQDRRLFNDVLAEVATFKQPDTPTDYGVYELKDEFYDEIDPWFWGYSRNQRQEVEEVLRKRFSRTKESTKPEDFETRISREEVWCPRLKILEVGSGFEGVGDIVHCEKFVEMLFFALWNTARSMLTPKRFRALNISEQQQNLVEEEEAVAGVQGDTVFGEAIHLVLLALEVQQNEIQCGWKSVREEIRLKNGEPNLTFVDIAANHTIHLNRRLPASCAANLADGYVDTGDGTTPMVQDAEEETTVYVNCEMTLLDLLLELAEHVTSDLVKEQASRVKWIIQQFEDFGDDKCKSICTEWRSFINASKNAQISSEQTVIQDEVEAQEHKSFMEKHSEDMAKELHSDAQDSDLKKNQEGDVSWEYPHGTCIVCQESTTSKMYGLIAFMQPSYLVRQLDLKDPQMIAAAVSNPKSLDVDVDRLAQTGSESPFEKSPLSFSTPSESIPGLGVDDISKANIPKHIDNKIFQGGTHVSSCGHLIHISCFKHYAMSVVQRQNAQQTRNHPESVSDKEFLCPLCKSLGNCLLPIAWNNVTDHVKSTAEGEEIDVLNSLGSWWINGAGVNICNSVTAVFKHRKYCNGILIPGSFFENMEGTVHADVDVEVQTLSESEDTDEEDKNGGDQNFLNDTEPEWQDVIGNPDEAFTESLGGQAIEPLTNLPVNLASMIERLQNLQMRRGLASRVRPQRTQRQPRRIRFRAIPNTQQISHPTAEISGINVDINDLRQCYQEFLEATCRVVSDQYENYDSDSCFDDFFWDSFYYTITCLEIAGRGQSTYSNAPLSLKSKQRVGVLNTLTPQMFGLLRVLSRTLLSYSAIKQNPAFALDFRHDYRQKNFQSELLGRKCDVLRSVFYGFVEHAGAVTQLLEIAATSRNSHESGHESPELSLLVQMQKDSQREQLDLITLKDDSFRLLVEVAFNIMPSNVELNSTDDSSNLENVYAWIGIFYILELVKVAVSVIESTVSGQTYFQDPIVVRSAHDVLGVATPVAKDNLDTSPSLLSIDTDEESDIDEESKNKRRIEKGKQPIHDTRQTHAYIPNLSRSSAISEDTTAFLNWLMTLLCVPVTIRKLALDNLDFKVVLALARSQALPYLRKTVILLQSRFHVVPVTEPEAELEEDEFARLSKYLHLPGVESVLSSRSINDDFISRLMAGWCLNLAVMHPQVFSRHRNENSTNTIVLDVPPENEDSAPMITYVSGDNRLSAKRHQAPVVTVPSRMNENRNAIIANANKLKSDTALTASLVALGKTAADEFEPVVTLSTPIIYELIKLPSRLDALFSYRTCIKGCNKGKPALCLVCGAIVCMQSFCCENRNTGESNNHASECTGNIGLFLNIQQCAIAYLYNTSKGCFAEAPYLDAHGETDTELKRHRPMFLSIRRYDEIRKSWLNHAIPSVVARRLESVIDLGGWSLL